MEIKYVTMNDKEFWFTLDKHLSRDEYDDKVRRKMGYVIFEDGKPIGILRYNLFWDSVPFCNMLYIAWEEHSKGYGRAIMEFWENDMKAQGFKMIMVSTQVDESAQHFYRKLGYQDAGCLLLTVPGFEQAMEMFFTKGI